MSGNDADIFLGLPLARTTLAGAVDALIARFDGSFSYVVTPNVDHVVRLDRASEDPVATAFAAAYADAALVLCDSRVLARLGRLSGQRLAVVPGSDLTRAVLTDPRLAGRHVAVIGGSAALLPTLATLLPTVRFSQHRPPMGVLRDERAQAAIEAWVADTAADLVLFSIGSPQAEIAAHRCYVGGQSRGVGLCSGASVEFMTGEQRRAPVWMQRAGIEWAFRLGSQPRRLWRRYLVEGPRVFGIWLRRRGR